MAVNRIEIEIDASAGKAKAGLGKVSSAAMETTRKIEQGFLATSRSVGASAAKTRLQARKAFAGMGDDFRDRVVRAVGGGSERLVKAVSGDWKNLAGAVRKTNRDVGGSFEREIGGRVKKVFRDIGESLKTGFKESLEKLSEFTKESNKTITSTFKETQKTISQVFFDAITGETVKLGSAFKNLGKRILKIWLDLLARMVVAFAASGIARLFGFSGPGGGPSGGRDGGSGGQGGRFAPTFSLGVPFAPGASNILSKPVGTLFGKGTTTGFGVIPAGGSLGQLTVGQVLGGAGVAAGGAFAGLAASRGDVFGSLTGVGGAALAGSAFGPVGAAVGAGVGGLGAIFGGLFGGGKKRPTFLSDRLSPQAFQDAFEIFSKGPPGFPAGKAETAARLVANFVENIGEAGQPFQGSKDSQADLQRAFTGAVNLVNRTQGGPAGFLFVPTGRTVFAAAGFSGIVRQPTAFIAGEAGPESVHVRPLRKRGGSEGRMTINIDLRGSTITSRRDVDVLARKIEAAIRGRERLRFSAA